MRETNDLESVQDRTHVQPIRSVTPAGKEDEPFPRGRVIGVQDNGDEFFARKICEERDSVDSDLRRHLCYEPARPVYDEPLAFVGTGAGPRPHLELFQKQRVGDLDRGSEVGAFHSDSDRFTLGE